MRALGKGDQHLMPETAVADDAMCWWPVAYIQNGQTGVACGKFATHLRVHPDCGCDTWLCNDCVVEFDQILRRGTNTAMADWDE